MVSRYSAIAAPILFIGITSYIVGLGGVPGVFGSGPDATNSTISPDNVDACDNGGGVGCGIGLASSAAGKILTFDTPHTWLSVIFVAFVIIAALGALSFIPGIG